MNIKIIEPNDLRLKEISSEVTDFDNPIYKEMIEEMIVVCKEHKAYASAAPQFGILKRFILMMSVNEVKVKDKEELDNLEIEYITTPYFNPVITSMVGKQYYFESCMSVNEATGKVARPYKITLEAQDISGNKFIKEATGFEAIILCHEIDHLDGIEFIDRAEEMYYNVAIEERIKIRQSNPHEVVNEDLPFTYSKTMHINK